MHVGFGRYQTLNAKHLYFHSINLVKVDPIYTLSGDPIDKFFVYILGAQLIASSYIYTQKLNITMEPNP